MRDAALKYGLFYGILFFGGVPVWWLTHRITDPTGGHGTSLLNSANPVLGLVLGLCAVGVALGLGFVSGRVVSGRAGVLNAGVALAWGAAGLGVLREIVLANSDAVSGAGGRGVLLKLAVEALVVGAVVVAGVWLIEKKARVVEGEPDGEVGLREMLISLAAGAFGCAAGVWLVAQSGYKGQVVGSAVVGGVIGGVLAVVGVGSGGVPVRLWPLVGGCVVVSAAGPLAGLFGWGSDAAVQAGAIAGTGARWAKLTGLDGVAGACMGLPVGLYVGRGLMGHAGKVAEEVG